MDLLAFILVGVFIFLLGWMTGNIVEWAMDTVERRKREERIANYNKRMRAEQERFKDLLEGRRGRE